LQDLLASGDAHEGLRGLTRSVVVPLMIFGQWHGCGSERGVYRSAGQHVRAAFPTLPTREQFHRPVHSRYDALVTCFLHRVQWLATQPCPHEALDSSSIPARDARHPSTDWWSGLVDRCWRKRLGWYASFHLRLAVTPRGVISSCGLSPASTADQALAETCYALRRHLHPGLTSLGARPPHPSLIRVTRAR
jgi:hypothetical protein